MPKGKPRSAEFAKGAKQNAGRTSAISARGSPARRPVPSGGPNNALSDNALSDNAPPNNATPNNAIPNSAIPNSAIPNNAIPNNAIPDNAFSDNAIQNSAILNNAIPIKGEQASGDPEKENPMPVRRHGGSRASGSVDQGDAWASSALTAAM